MEWKEVRFKKDCEHCRYRKNCIMIPEVIILSRCKVIIEDKDSDSEDNIHYE